MKNKFVRGAGDDKSSFFLSPLPETQKNNPESQILRRSRRSRRIEGPKGEVKDEEKDTNSCLSTYIFCGVPIMRLLKNPNNL